MGDSANQFPTGARPAHAVRPPPVPAPAPAPVSVLSYAGYAPVAVYDPSRRPVHVITSAVILLLLSGLGMIAGARQAPELWSIYEQSRPVQRTPPIQVAPAASLKPYDGDPIRADGIKRPQRLQFIAQVEKKAMLTDEQKELAHRLLAEIGAQVGDPLDAVETYGPMPSVSPPRPHCKITTRLGTVYLSQSFADFRDRQGRTHMVESNFYVDAKKTRVPTVRAIGLRLEQSIVRNEIPPVNAIQFAAIVDMGQKGTIDPYSLPSMRIVGASTLEVAMPSGPPTWIFQNGAVLTNGPGSKIDPVFGTAIVATPRTTPGEALGPTLGTLSFAEVCAGIVLAAAAGIAGVLLLVGYRGARQLAVGVLIVRLVLGMFSLIGFIAAYSHVAGSAPPATPYVIGFVIGMLVPLSAIAVALGLLLVRRSQIYFATRGECTARGAWSVGGWILISMGGVLLVLHPVLGMSAGLSGLNVVPGLLCAALISGAGVWLLFPRGEAA